MPRSVILVSATLIVMMRRFLTISTSSSKTFQHPSTPPLPPPGTAREQPQRTGPGCTLPETSHSDSTALFLPRRRVGCGQIELSVNLAPQGDTLCPSPGRKGQNFSMSPRKQGTRAAVQFSHSGILLGVWDQRQGESFSPDPCLPTP